MQLIECVIQTQLLGSQYWMQFQPPHLTANRGLPYILCEINHLLPASFPLISCFHLHAFCLEVPHACSSNSEVVWPST